MVLGVDPGVSGAIVSLTTDREITLFTQLPIKLPSKDINFDLVLGILQSCKNNGVTHLFLERALPMAMGAKHAFNYGRGFAAIEIAVSQSQIPVTYVEPAKWTKEICDGIDSRLKAKERSYIAFERLFPGTDKVFTIGKQKKPHPGLIDALLIAEYGLRKLSK